MYIGFLSNFDCSCQSRSSLGNDHYRIGDPKPYPQDILETLVRTNKHRNNLSISLKFVVRICLEFYLELLFKTSVVISARDSFSSFCGDFYWDSFKSFFWDIFSNSHGFLLIVDNRHMHLPGNLQVYLQKLFPDYSRAASGIPPRMFRG